MVSFGLQIAAGMLMLMAQETEAHNGREVQASATILTGVELRLTPRPTEHAFSLRAPQDASFSLSSDGDLLITSLGNDQFKLASSEVHTLTVEFE